MDDGKPHLTPRGRQSWQVDADRAPSKKAWTSDEERAAAKRILWRDSATILVGVIVALLAFQMFLRGSGGVAPASDATGLPSGLIVGSGGPTRSAGPRQTFGPILDPSLGIDGAPTKSPARTLPPTGSQRPATPAPIVTPRPPTPRPPTPGPTQPGPTEAPPTQPPPTQPPPTQPPPTEPPPTEPPPSLAPSTAALR